MKRIILGLCVALVLAAGPAFATSKSTTDLQTDLATYKLRGFNAESDYQMKLNITDSMFNKTTDTLDDIATGSTYSLVAAANATYLGQLVATGVTAAEIAAAADLSASFEVVAATNVLGASECGKTMTLAHATEFVTTLPTATAGCKFRFIVGLAPASASYTIVTPAGANLIYGGVTSNEIDDTTDSAAAASDGSDVVTFVDGQAVKGDWVEFVSDGTSWYVSGNSKVRAGITFGQT